MHVLAPAEPTAPYAPASSRTPWPAAANCSSFPGYAILPAIPRFCCKEVTLSVNACIPFVINHDDGFPGKPSPAPGHSNILQGTGPSLRLLCRSSTATGTGWICSTAGLSCGEKKGRGAGGGCCMAAAGRTTAALGGAFRGLHMQDRLSQVLWLGCTGGEGNESMCCRETAGGLCWRSTRRLRPEKGPRLQQQIADCRSAHALGPNRRHVSDELEELVETLLCSLPCMLDV